MKVVEVNLVEFLSVHQSSQIRVHTSNVGDLEHFARSASLPKAEVVSCPKDETGPFLRR